MLAEYIKEAKLRMFLLKNLQRIEKNNFEWLINLSTLKKYLPHIIDGFDDWGQKIITHIKANFIRGEHSSYLRKDFEPIIKRIFPNNDILTIPQSGHWVHADNTNYFINTIKNCCT